MINIYTPDISKYTKSAIDAIQTGWISNLGKYVNLAKEELLNKLKCKYIVLTNNGTTSTHCLFMALKYKYPNIKKIYVPNNVYVAVWNAALMEYDLSNLEVLKTDIDTYNFDLSELDRLEQNSCLVIVHNVGNIIDTNYIKSKRPDLVLLEDNCEGLFGKVNSNYTSSCADVFVSSCSFYGNKVITSGEGGAFFTNDEEVYNFIQKTTHQGQTTTRYIHDVLGYNYRMTNIEAAFLYDQMKDIDNILHNKIQVFNIYNRLLEPLVMGKFISLQKINSNCERAYWMYILRIPGKDFEDISMYMKNKNVDTRPFFYPIQYHNHLKSLMIEDNTSNILSKECVIIPSSPNLKIEEQIYVVQQIVEYLKDDLGEQNYEEIKEYITDFD